MYTYIYIYIIILVTDLHYDIKIVYSLKYKTKNQLFQLAKQ